MPDYDAELDPVRMLFMLDTDYPTVSGSPVHILMDRWRAFVRAGRGAFGNEQAVRLNQRYRIDYAFDVHLRLLRGGKPQLAKLGVTSNSSKSQSAATASRALRSNAFDSATDLEVTALITLERTWLSSFKLTDLNYAQGNTHAMIEAAFFAENVLNESARGLDAVLELAEGKQLELGTRAARTRDLFP